MIRVWARAAAIQLEEIAAANATAAAAATTTRPDLRSRNGADARSTTAEAGVVTEGPSATESSSRNHVAQDLRALHDKIERAAAARHAEIESNHPVQSEKKVDIISDEGKSARSHTGNTGMPTTPSPTAAAPLANTGSQRAAPPSASLAQNMIANEAPAESSKAAQERAASQATPTKLASATTQDLNGESTGKEQVSLPSRAEHAEAVKAAPLLSAAAPDPLPPQAATESPSLTASYAPSATDAVVEQEEEVRMLVRIVLIPSHKSCCVRQKCLRLE